MRSGSDQATPVPMDESLAANPPEGAVLDYFLKEKPRSPIQLEIFGSEGKLVRRFASDEVLHRTSPNDVPIQVEWIRNAKPLLAEAGVHRVVWDLHYPLPKGVRRSFWGPRGPSAVPREYTGKLTADRERRHAPFTIEVHPPVP